MKQTKLGQYAIYILHFYANQLGMGPTPQKPLVGIFSIPSSVTDVPLAVTEMHIPILRASLHNVILRFPLHFMNPVTQLLQFSIRAHQRQ
jgi:hypothetical protein